MEQKKYDAIIVGGGARRIYGCALLRAGRGSTPSFLEMMAPGGQMTTTNLIDNYPGFNDGIGGLNLAKNESRCRALWR